MENAEDQATVEESTDEQAGETEETSEVVLTSEAEESALLENEEPMEEEGLQQTSESLLEENDIQETSDVAAVSGEAEGNDAVLEDSVGSGIGGEEAKHEEEEEEEEEIKLSDSEMPQVNVATLGKRKWQVKIYPLKPDDFVNGQVAKVFSNAKESLLYLYSSGKYSGGKGEMYVSTEVQAAKVVHNLMKLDFKSQNINIEIIRKNNEGVVEEKAFMRFDAKLIRILCVPSFRSRRLGNRRERIIGSVFVKNLPIGTSKDMLRVMFPFAPEINYNPEKFTDGTARLVLNARSAVGPCMKGFTKLELGGSLLEMRPLQKKEKSQDAGDKESTKKTEATGEAGDLSETESKPSDSKKDGKATPKASGDKTSAKPAAAKKSPAASKSGDDKKEKKEDAAKPRVPSKNPRAQGGNRYNPRDNNHRDAGTGTFRPRGGNFGQRGMDRYRFRAAGFGNRFRPDDRRMRMQGAGREPGINTGAAKEMLLLQSQLSVAIKNQLSMLNQTQFALQQAKQEAATINFSREAGQGSSSGLLNRRMSNQQRSEQPRVGQMRAGQVRGGQTRAGQVRGGQLRAGQVRTDNRRQQNKRGKPRERRTEGRGFGGGSAEYSYKRNATMAGLSADYGATGMGKRRSTGFGGHSDSFGGHSDSFGGHNESHSWAEDRAAPAFGGHTQAPAFGYPEFDDREAEFHNLHTSMSPRSLNYNNSNYGYRY